MSYGSSKMSNPLSFSFWVLLESVLFFNFHICLAVFLIFALNWCAVWKFQSVHFVQLFLSNLCAIFGRIPYSLCCFFILGIWVLIEILFGSFCVHLSLLISESICVLSSHVLPKCHQIIVVLCLAYLFFDFGINVWFESAVFLILWCLFIFSLSSYLCLDLHKFHFTNSIVFSFWYILLFFSRFTESPVLHNSVLAVLLKKIIFPHRKFLILWILQDWGVREKAKKESFQKTQ